MSVPAAGTVIEEKYELIHELGRGGMGVVWRAHARRLDVPCAIKFVLPHHASDPAIRARFLREARAAAKVRGAHTVSIFDVGEWEGYPFLVMEMLEGQSLERRLSDGRPLSPELTAGIIEQVALGLSKVHAAGMVHRDLKPENIHLVEESPLQVKILDFGIVKQLDAASGFRTAAGAIMGTPYYMSPEQAHGRPVDARADLWSLAMVAYQCLTARLPFEAESLADLFVQIVSGPIPSPRALNPALSPAVEAWWFQSVSRDPAGRPASALALAEGLRRAVSSAGAAESMVLAGTFEPVSSEAPAGVPVRGRKRRRAFLFGVVAASVLFAAAWGARELVGSEPSEALSADVAASALPAATPGPTAPAPIELLPPRQEREPVVHPPASVAAPASAPPAASLRPPRPARVPAARAPAVPAAPAAPVRPPPSQPVHRPAPNDRLGI